MGTNINETIEEFRTISKHDSRFNKCCAKIAKDLIAKNITLTSLVEELGIYLTDKNPNQREIGTCILSKVIENLPIDWLSDLQLSFTATFFADRLKDHHQVIPSTIEGILAISECKHLSDASVTEVLSAIFNNVPCQQQQKQDRFNMYLIFKNLLDNKLTALQKMELNFVYGVIQAIDGERDPQNLNHLFNWLPKFLKSIKFGHLCVEIFEILACYFPVDFKYPSGGNDSESITRETLANGLAPCLCAIPEFGEYCLPLILEKLSSGLVVAKLDSLQLFINSCNTFKTDVYLTHCTDICTQLISEIQNPKEPDVEKKSLEALTAFIRKISHNLTEDDEKYVQKVEIVDDLIQKIKENLRPDQKLFSSSAKILQAISAGSKYASCKVTGFVLPLFINQFNITATVAQRVILFKSLIDFVCTYAELNAIENLSEVPELAEIPGLCLQALLNDEAEVRAASLQSLQLLAKILPENVRQLIYKNFTTFLIIEQPEQVRKNLLKCFVTLSETYPTEVKEKLLPEIVAENETALNLHLEALTLIALQKEFSNSVITILCNYCMRDSPTANLALHYLNNLLKSNSNSATLHKFLYEDFNLVHKLIPFASSASDSNSESYLSNLSQVIAQLVAYQSAESQQIILNEFCKDSLIEKISQPVCLFLLWGLLLNARKNVNIPNKSIIFNSLIEAILNIQSSDYVRTASAQLMANFLNKSEDETELKNMLDIVSSKYKAEKIEDDFSNRSSSRIMVLCWTAKALVVRQHSLWESWTNELINVIEKHQQATKGLKLIISDESTCLSSYNYCTIRFLYKQKFFSTVCDKLINCYDQETNANCLMAFGYMLQETPIEILLIYFKKILKLTVLCLDRCDDADVLATVLNKLNHLINNNKQLMEEYIQEFLPRFLNLCTFKASMKVRIAAIQCLQNYTIDYPIYKLLPHKQDVIHKLANCVDDPKRIVRKEAVTARSSWFLLDAPS